MKTIFRTFILIFLFFNQIGFSQENKKWIKATIFTKTDTIQGFVKTNSISFDSVKFKKNLDEPTEHLTPELIEGYQTTDYLYQKKFIKKIGSFGYYKFGKLIDKGKFNLYETTEQYSSSQNSILILEFNNQIITFKFYTFQKLKNKKKIAKELDGYHLLQNIVLKRKFDYNSFIEEIKKLNSK
ncbi:hypothetical protein [Winogradskyella sp. SM1960]|uniref:hypothetical protein n=1 Tax=Winogradskyella sp. SM1960 TaxID=2865955 RepID=UPI001CD2EEE1|nr:hypothetical protein [Winogradskyella sp. SM1960]